jgi:hypothetical protein
MADDGVPARDDPLEEDLRDAVLTALGFATVPETDLEGLTALYTAWCERVPFDNVRKLISLADAARDPGPPPPLAGGRAADFFTAWLAHRTGGTCWPSANALHALLVACGFESRRVAASMFETGEPSHGTTIVTIETDLGRRQHLVDTSMLTSVPLPLDPTADTAIRHPVFASQAQVVPEGWRFEFPLVNAVGTLPCRTLSPAAVGLPFFLERYEISRAWSPFNEQVSTRQSTAAGTLVSYGGGRRYERTAGGVTDTELRGDALRVALVEEAGMSEQIVEQLFATYAPVDRPTGAP